jgi:aminoglycoside phosphotransferase (APT) family kinase protein
VVASGELRYLLVDLEPWSAPAVGIITSPRSSLKPWVVTGMPRYSRGVREWAAEVTVDEALARRLIRAQFPDVGLRSLSLLGQGWDTTVWLVDDEWVFRFPRRETVIRGLVNEISHLPKLAQLMPLPIPRPTYVGEPSLEYGWPFYGAPFLPGRELANAGLDDRERAALGRPLGYFLRALHDTSLGADLPIDPVRRADMTFRVPKTRERLAELEQLGLWRAPRQAHDVIEAAAELGPPEPTALVHGDLHLRHLLVDDVGRATAVIDWIDLSYNTPGVDFVLYWSVLPPEGRRELRTAYGPITEDQILCARILSLFLCGTLALYGHQEGMPQLKREAIAGLDRTLDPG